MIPLHDDVPARRRPVVTWALIAVNAAVFLAEATLPRRELGALLHRVAVVPRREVELASLWAAHHFAVPPPPGLWAPVLVSLFLHGGWLHVAGNLLFLWIFGDNVEDRLGRPAYLAFYLLSGIVATAAEVAIAPHSGLPVVGASGAIAGVLGAYLRWYPKARVRTLVFFGFLITTAEVPAATFLVLWLLVQAVSGVAQLARTGGDVGGVAWWAHLGGFAFGLVVASLWSRGAGPGAPPPYRPADRWYSNRR